MKKLLLVAVVLAAILSLVGVGKSQTRGNADPTGFLTLTITGTGGASSSYTSYLGLGVTGPVVYQRTAATVGSNTITDSGASWTANQFAGSNGAYFLEITSINGSISANGVGTTYAIVSNTTNTLTLATNLATGVSAPVGYKIRKQWTIAGVFGAGNSAGLQAGSETTADLVQLWNGSSLDSYYYLSGSGWRRVGDTSTDASSVVIPFYRAVVVKRQQGAALSLALSGTVKTGLTSIPVNAGDNYLGNVYPASFTLGTSGLYTGDSSTGVQAGDAASADLVMFWNGSAFDSYYYQTGSGWRKVGDASTDAGAKTIAAGTGFILRRVGSSSFNWRAPETLVASAGGGSPGQLLNISTRGFVQTGDRVLIGGFIITGTGNKDVVLRARGPSLTSAGLSDVLADPYLELHDATGAIIGSNDDWGTASNASTLNSLGLAPTNSKEAALLQTLAPGAYTAIMRGADGGTGIGLVEAYDVSSTTTPKLANISTRGYVGTDNNVLIGGIILNGSGTQVVVRALGPSLSNSGVSGVLADPVLTLVNSNGATVATNDSWSQDSSAALIQAHDLAPSNSAEAATLQTLSAGAYTVIVRGASGGTGVALVEAYEID